MAADTLEPVTPSESEASVARESSLRLASYLKKVRKHQGKRRPRIFLDEARGEALDIPGHALELLVSLLEQMAKGNGVMIIAVDHELTTQQAADLLNVSRPYLVRLLDEGKIPHRKVGKHRRVPVKELMEYKRKTDKKRRAALDELAEQAQELKMGY